MTPENLPDKNTGYVLDDALWDRLIELTNGSAGLCYQCGVCTASCPWGLVRQETLSVRAFMRQAQLGLQDGNENLWLCTTCGQCEVYCPRGVNICQVFRALRTIAWENRQVLDGLPSLLWSMFWNGNPWTQPPSQRATWSKGLDLEFYDPVKHEILLYVGCTSSFDQRAQKIARALVRIMNAAGVQYGYLGEEEPCCGEAALSTGNLPYFNEIAEQTTKVLEKHQVSSLVTISPHCYDVFMNHYPLLGAHNRILVRHYTQFMADLVKDRRLIFDNPAGPGSTRSQESSPGNKILSVTFQDPCYLGRHNKEYDAPREVIGAIPNASLVEMNQHAENGLCCGGGGGRMWMETAPGERFSDLRIMQARDTGAEVLLTACPFCVVCLEDSLKSKKIPGIAVLDIAEFAAANL
jgi:Fe-S oxidoreductase